MFNKKAVLKNNIEAIEIAISWSQTGHILTKEEKEVLSNYAGFGGLKACLMNPFLDEEWEDTSASNKELRYLFEQLHNILRENFSSSEYREIISSIHNSILTAFYTAKVIPDTFYRVLNELQIPIESLYEPSAGAGIFITNAVENKVGNTYIAYEKDRLTALVLKALCSAYEESIVVNNLPFEESSSLEKGMSDIIISNIPFGEFRVFDSYFRKYPEVTDKIHNYFFAKGIEKLKEGGLLVYLVSSAFLNTKSNKPAREYLFALTDFISLTVMPDDLMHDNAGTMAPSHFLVVQKNSKKAELSTEEEQLVNTVEVVHLGNGEGYRLNEYIEKHSEEITIGSVSQGKDQYGKPAQEVHWYGDISAIALPFWDILIADLSKRYKYPLLPELNFDKGIFAIEIPVVEVKQLTGKDLEKWNKYIEIKELFLELQTLENEKV